MNQTIITWINNQRAHDREWDWLLNVGRESEMDLQQFLKNKTDEEFWPSLTVEDWRNIVLEQKRLSDEKQRIIDKEGATVIGDVLEDNTIVLPIEPDSAWQNYKRRLLEKEYGESSVHVIEDASIKTARRLNRDTLITGPVKGLVVGNVQSGKTGNMAALISMAADNGWNFFIILSGMIESLRLQTMRRLRDDLMRREGQNHSRFYWHSIDNPERVPTYNNDPKNFDFSINSNQRFISICLKNSTRLRNLIGWLKCAEKKREDIRLLIIDDESDQASINTATGKERTTINQLILDLVNNRDERGKPISYHFGAVNYIGYTATPFAVVLNEGPGLNSLYPSSFISTLSVSDEYFGPQQIFGCDEAGYNGLDVVREISYNDIVIIKDIHQGDSIDIPESLVESICWFLCGVACFRYWKRVSPVSMLIHTSRNTIHHNLIANAIENWFNSTPHSNILNNCREIWDRETQKFDENTFRIQYPNYGKMNGHQNLTLLPDFKDIKDGILSLLHEGISEIILDVENQQPLYTNGIHLCIDNSERNDDPNSMRRLVYPESYNMPDQAPAFIVIGGQTLSRGLTIEGLVITFFLRSSMTADTLMQMGRWFGYRRGYELLPRIWMSERARRQFEFLAEMDYALRQEIKEMADSGVNYSQIGPRIKTSPEGTLVKIVADNRMQEAVPVLYDFSGRKMETAVFNNDAQMLRDNLKTAEDFIKRLGNPENNHLNPHNYLWRGITTQEVIDFLTKYKYSERLRGFNDIKPLITWLETVSEEGHIGNWNVILGGNKTGNNKWSPTDNISINKVDHSNKYDGGNIINIGVLRTAEDYLTDIPQENTQEQKDRIQLVKDSHKLSEINSFRNAYGMKNTPQILIYVVNKDSMPRPNSKRFPLNAEEDIVGFSINIPGDQTRNMVRAIQINIPEMDLVDID